MATMNDLKKDVVIKFHGEPYVIIDFQHARTAQRQAFVRAKLRSLISGKVIEYTFKAGEKIDIADVEKKPMQYLYSDGKGSNFIDAKTYEQIFISVSMMGQKEKYLEEGAEVRVLFFEEKPIAIEIPIKVKLKVISAPPAVRGDSASGHVTKEVECETGLKLNAPLFIKEGDEIIINTGDGEYVERSS